MHYLQEELYRLVGEEPSIFDFLQSSSLDGLWYWDLEQPENEWMNPRFWEVLGYDPAKMPHKAEAWQDLIFPEDRALALANARAHFEDPAFPYDQVVRYRHRSGDTVWIRCRGMAIRDEAGNPVRMLGAHVDVSAVYAQHEQARQALKEYQTMIDNQSVYVIKIDREGNYTFVNDFYCEDFQWPREEIIGKSSSLGLIEEDVIKAWQAGEEAFTNPGQKIKQILTKELPDGSQKVSEWEFSALLDEEGNPEEILCIGHDITERVQAERQLKYMNTILEQAGQLARIGAWEVDLKSKRLVWTPVTYAIHEVPPDFQPTTEAAITFFKEDDARDRLYKHFYRCAEEGIPYDEEVQIVTHQGHEKWVRVMGAAAMEHGKCVKVFGTIQDIDEQKKTDEEIVSTSRFLEQTSHVARVGGWSYDLATGQVDWTRSVNDIIGADKDYQPVLEEVLSMYTPESATTLQAAMERAIGQGEPYDLELEFITVPGRKIWLKAIGQADFKDGQCVRLYGTVQDIHQMKVYQQELKEAKMAAEAASVAKSDFLANMSHEIRTPLNSVIGFSDLLIQTQLDADQRNYLQYVHHSAHALLDLINDILDFSKIEAGKLELDVQKTDLWQLCDQIADIIRYKTSEKGLDLLIERSSDLPRYIYADPVRLRQVLINLIGNAVKFTDEGHVKLTVSMEASMGAKRSRLLFSVQDTGIGIAPEQQGKIFRAFDQEDASITRKYGGTGLGLSISNSLLGLMGTELQLKSALGQGSDFYFSIELETENQEADPDMLSAEVLASIGHILIVDDHTDNRRTLEQMLRRKEIAHTSVTNGLEALQFLSQNTVDLVLMNYQIPFFNGLEITQKIREELNLRASELPVVLLHSQNHDAELKAEAQRCGVTCILGKPVAMRRLYGLLVELKTQAMEVPSSQAEVAPHPASEQSYQILLVDDNAMNRVLARKLIQSTLPQVKIEEASHGVEAIERWETHTPDLIFMDVQMPQMSGYEAAQEIRRRERGQRTPIIALTAGVVKGESERCLAAGMDAYLSKPIDQAQFRETLAAWLPMARPVEQKQPELVAISSSSRRQAAAPAHFNRAYLREATGAQGEEMVDEVIDMLREGLLWEVIAQLREQVDLQASPTTIQGLAHNLRGGASSAGCEVLADLAQALEYLEPFSHPQAQQLVTQLEAEHDVILGVLRD